MQKSTISVFAQICQLLPRKLLENISSKYHKAGNATKYGIWDLFVALAFCHIADCSSLRQVEEALYSAVRSLPHAKGAQAIKRTTLAYANSQRDYRIFEEFYKALHAHFSQELKDGNMRPLARRYKRKTFALDSTTISLCMKLFPWAKYRSTKGGIKLHTALSLETLMPSVVVMTPANRNDSTQALPVINELPEFACVVMDRGYNDYSLFSYLTDRGTTFVTRLKDNASISPKLLKQDPNNQWKLFEFRFNSEKAQAVCGDKKFHLIEWYDDIEGRWFQFLTNDLTLTAQEVASLYQDRWQIELFFKKIKQNLRVKSFIGTTVNAVMNQIWTACIVTLLLELLKRRATHKWSFSGLAHFLHLNLLCYVNLTALLNHPLIEQNQPISGGGTAYQQEFLEGFLSG